MGDPRAFLRVVRKKLPARPVEKRVHDCREVDEPFPELELRAQATRCMDCGVPFCHGGCPLRNLIPDWNALVAQGRTDAALGELLRTNNFPEVTSRVCPAPCEASCVLALDNALLGAVTIKAIERSIADVAMRELRPAPVKSRTGCRVVVVGSGPAGLAAAQELARRGHDVTVVEKDDRPRRAASLRNPRLQARKERVWICDLLRWKQKASSFEREFTPGSM